MLKSFLASALAMSPESFKKQLSNVLADRCTEGIPLWITTVGERKAEPGLT